MEESPVYEFESPKLVDPEGHALKLQVIGFTSAKSLISVTVSDKNDVFTLSVNRLQITNSGQFNATMVFGDVYQPMGGFQQISVVVNFMNKTVEKEGEQVEVGQEATLETKHLNQDWNYKTEILPNVVLEKWMEIEQKLS